MRTIKIQITYFALLCVAGLALGPNPAHAQFNGHNTRSDFIAGLGIYAPTGKYDPGGDENLGLGMWSFEVFGGTTLYLDKAKSWHFAATAFYETHTDKKDTKDSVPLADRIDFLDSKKTE